MCVMAVRLLDGQELPLVWRRCLYHPRPVFPPMVSVAKGRHDQNAAVALTMHATKPKAQGMRRHIPLELVAKAKERALASLVRKGGSSLTRCVMIGDGLRVSCPGVGGVF